ncbi:mitochondrial DNA primase [Trypanosoma grayi]|uniref:mitochondrial DNA primase n=1 Tax=Trypanosoma grayi TaxID=71804 RepID=UPI0004F4A108|nr:mitochondrial DNA primase [Trypanosoma grayi]KEG09015.1 mitochondrial DNA primase [Trypanosoma grayi]
MLRFSLSVRQVSKRLVAELAAINTAQEAGDRVATETASTSAAVTATAGKKSSSPAAAAAAAAPTASSGPAPPAAASTTVRAAAEAALRGAGPQTASQKPIPPAKITAAVRRLKKRAREMISDVPAAPAKAANDAERAPAPEPVQPKKSGSGENPVAESQQVKKKKKKMAKTAHSSGHTAAVNESASSSAAPSPQQPAPKTEAEAESPAAKPQSLSRPPLKKTHASEVSPEQQQRAPATGQVPKTEAEAESPAAKPQSLSRPPLKKTHASEVPPTPAAARATSVCSTSAAAAASDAEKGANPQHKTAMVKAFRIEDVLAACTSNDGVFARRLPQGGCQFFAWPGTPLMVASNAVATMPDTIRTVHAIFGREKTPLDLVLDIDCPVPQEHWSMAKIRPFQKKLLDDVMTVVTEEIEAIGEKIATQVVLQSPNLKKASFHVHTKLQDTAFEDYHSLHGFLHRFHKRIPTVDLQIYRPNGMLRMHRCMKENHTSAIVVFEDERWNIGFPKGVVSDADAALHSACIREAGTFTRLLHFDAPRSLTLQDDASGSGSSGAAGTAVKLPPVLLPRTESEAVGNASAWLRHGAREIDVGEWRTWISLGINAYRIAYHFRDAQTLKRPAMEELLDAWVEASKKSPMKFRSGVCESKWTTFDINKLSKSKDYDWWASYQRIGRMALKNEAAEAAVKEAPAASSNAAKRK